MTSACLFYGPNIAPGENGLKYSAAYGYVGIYTEYEPFVVEGVNESGLSAIKDITLVTLNHKIGSVHWRIAQPDGRMVVLEVVAGVPHFYENTLGVLTNAPGFPETSHLLQDLSAPHSTRPQLPYGLPDSRPWYRHSIYLTTSMSR